MASDSKYLQEQKKFWDADEKTSRFDLIDSVSRTEYEYNRRADQDFEIVVSGVRITPNWTVLEIGCGVGRLLSRLLSRANPGKVIGVDNAGTGRPAHRQHIRCARNRPPRRHHLPGACAHCKQG